MTYDEGRALIADMLKEYKITNWSNSDLISYITDRKQSGYIEMLNNEIIIDGHFTIPELEAILLAAHNERGAPRG